MYMREMGSVELLTREGEIVIAKRIEDGVRQVMGAIVQYPDIVQAFIDEYDHIVGTDGRLNDLLTGYYDEEAATKPIPALEGEIDAEDGEPKAKPQASDDEDEDEDSTNSEDDFGDAGPDPVYTAECVEELRKILKRYTNAAKRYGKKDKNTLKHQQ